MATRSPVATLPSLQLFLRQRAHCQSRPQEESAVNRSCRCQALQAWLKSFTPPCGFEPWHRQRNLPRNPAVRPRFASPPRRRNLTKAPSSLSRGSSPRPPCSARLQAAVPWPATPRTADKNKSSAPPTSAAASLRRSAQTCTPLPTSVLPRSRACSADKQWVAWAPHTPDTFTFSYPIVTHKYEERFQ